MLYAVIAIFIMFVANYLITFARTRLSGFKRKVTSFFAFLLLFPALLFILKALL
jgi:hypothetical protein